MQQGLRLLGDGRDDFRVGVSHGGDGDSASEIEVAFAVFIPDFASGSTMETQVETPVGGHDITVEQIAGGGGS